MIEVVFFPTCCHGESRYLCSIDQASLDLRASDSEFTKPAL